MWRCEHCGTLHCLEDIDYGRYYEDYPLQRQALDFPTRRLLRSRVRELVRGGVRADQAILDFGCGNGAFVRYLRQSGYARAEGYDPFSSEFSDRAVLGKRFDVVLSQDVLEHAAQPLQMLDETLRLVAARGMIVIGTPDASRLDLADPLDSVGRLHQPFHRHLLAAEHLKRLVERRGFRVTRMVHRWFVDTRLPFLNSSFLFRYVKKAGGHIDAMFEPVRPGLVVSSPRLLFYAFAGGFINPAKDVVLFATPAA